MGFAPGTQIRVRFIDQPPMDGDSHAQAQQPDSGRLVPGLGPSPDGSVLDRRLLCAVFDALDPCPQAATGRLSLLAKLAARAPAGDRRLSSDRAVQDPSLSPLSRGANRRSERDVAAVAPGDGRNVLY